MNGVIRTAESKWVIVLSGSGIYQGSAMGVRFFYLNDEVCDLPVNEIQFFDSREVAEKEMERILCAAEEAHELGWEILRKHMSVEVVVRVNESTPEGTRTYVDAEVCAEVCARKLLPAGIQPDTLEADDASYAQEIQDSEKEDC